MKKEQQFLLRSRAVYCQLKYQHLIYMSHKKWK